MASEAVGDNMHIDTRVFKGAERTEERFEKAVERRGLQSEK